MERNITEYEENYSEAVCGFEKYKAIYRRKKILEIIDNYQPETILEIGCGPEPLFCYEKGRNFTIVEPSDRFYENAKRLSAQNNNITCIKGFLEEEVHYLHEMNSSYDMIVCSSLLHEVEKPGALLEAIRRVSTNKTVIHISVPNMYSIHRLLGVEMGILSDVFDMSEGNKILQQNTNFDIHRLRTIVENYGMKVEEDGSYFVKPFSHRQMGEMIKRQIIDEKVLDGLYKLTTHMPEYGSEIYVNCRVKE